jgi:hypothetical protein
MQQAAADLLALRSGQEAAEILARMRHCQDHACTTRARHRTAEKSLFPLGSSEK